MPRRCLRAGRCTRTALPMAIGVALGDFSAMTLCMLGLDALEVGNL